MLPSLTLRADRLPVSGLGYEDIHQYSTRMEGARASGRTVFRESYLNSATMEVAISAQAMEMLENAPDDLNRYYSDRRSWARVKGLQPQVKAEDYLPRYGPEEFEAMGFTVHEKIEFDDDGKLSLPRFSIRTEAYEANQADAAAMEAMPAGILSFGAQIGGGLAASIGDPINLIPFGGAISKAKSLNQAGKLSKGAIMGQAVKTGVVDGALSTAVVDAISFPYANEWGADLGLTDALADIAIGGAFGGLFGTLGGAVELHSYRMAETHLNASIKTISDMERGLAPDVEAALAPTLNEGRARQAEAFQNPDYLNELLRRESATLAENVIATRRRLDDLASGRWKESELPSHSKDGPSLVLGNSPPVLRLLDDMDSSLELPVNLAQRLLSDQAWKELDLGELPRALARAAAVFELDDGRRAALVMLKSTSGEDRPVLAELRRVVKTHQGQTRSYRPGDDVNEISRLDILDGSTEGRALEISQGAAPVYADPEGLDLLKKKGRAAAALAEVASVGEDLPGPAALARRLAVEDQGLDLEQGRVLKLRDEALEEVEAPAAMTPEARARREQSRDLQMEMAEAQLREMGARGELSPEEIDDLNGIRTDENGNRIDEKLIEDAEVKRAEDLAAVTECVIGGWLQ